jgi:N-formylglutamate deformylase
MSAAESGETPIGERYLGASPLIISLPHVGTELPSDIERQLTPGALKLIDTDWYVDQLSGFARAAGVSWLRARYSRYLIDLNRPPDDHALYPGQRTSKLCPTHTFLGEALYEGAEPGAEEIERRRKRYWEPYHAALRELIEATRARFGFAVLLDAHSIRSELPLLFPGRLPDVNVGTNEGRSCAAVLTAAVLAVLQQQQRFTHVLNGRFKGGHITRAFGDPTAGVHAMQLELAQSAYMDEATPGGFESSRAGPLQTLLQPIVAAMSAFRPTAPGR